MRVGEDLRERKHVYAHEIGTQQEVQRTKNAPDRVARNSLCTRKPGESVCVCEKECVCEREQT